MRLRLSPPAHRRLEEFFREHTGDPSLRLPPLALSTGPAAALVTRALGISAITLGRRVIIAPALVQRDERGGLWVPAELLVHEAAHVLQYGQAGWILFLARYARDYVGGLRERGPWNADARQAAYRGIGAERAARTAATAYLAWSGARGEWRRPPQRTLSSVKVPIPVCRSGSEKMRPSIFCPSHRPA